MTSAVLVLTSNLCRSSYWIKCFRTNRGYESAFYLFSVQPENFEFKTFISLIVLIRDILLFLLVTYIDKICFLLQWINLIQNYYLFIT